MELQLREHDWRLRRPDVGAALAAGLVAGAALMVIELAWAASIGGDPWRVSRLVAALVLGPGILEGSGFALGVVAVALLTHYLLGVLFGLVLAYVIAGFNYDDDRGAGMMQVIGAVFGMALYLLNFHGLGFVFPWLAELRGWATFVAHLVFGIAAAFTYWKLERQRA